MSSKHMDHHCSPQAASQNFCICFNIRKASRAITQTYDDMFRKLGLRSTQVFMLACLSNKGPLTILEMAQAMATDRTTITRNLRPLTRDKFIKIQYGKDKRRREIIVTAKGQKAAHEARGIFTAFQKKLYEKMDREKVESFCANLSDMVETVNKL